ncbi:MAG: protein kinase domain-containing protein, partial [Cyanobacteriota bacterium]
MKLCRNPACPNPNNPLSNRYCQSCGVSLDQDYIFRSRYQVKRLLGQGAFGRTYQAEDLDCLNRPCVIKKFIGTPGKGLELFQREAEKLLELDSSQIPKLYAYFQQDNSFYLVQQFIDGEDLFKTCLKCGTFNEADILTLLSDLLPVLDYIHNRGLLHRDIKPENVMRHGPHPLAPSPTGRGGKLVLIDFGGAKQITGTLQGTPGTQLYTPGYAAIEQVMGSPLPASDIYSLGATCIRLLTGIFPQYNAYGDLIDDLYDTLNVRWVWREKLAEQGKTISDRLA